MSNTVIVRPNVKRVVVRAPGPQGPPGSVTGVAVSSVAGRTGDVVLTKGDVGLSNVDNTADASKPVSTAQAAADASVASTAAAALASHVSDPDPHPGYQKETEKGVANGYASLGSDGKVPSEQLPALGSSVMTPRCNVSSTSGSTTTSIPFDNTIPQITEGGEIISLASVTPSSASSKILVQFSTFCVASTSNAMPFALFDGSTNAVAASVTVVATSGTMVSASFLIDSWSGSKNLSIRAGPPAGTLYWLRSAAEEKFSTARQSVITAIEIPAS